MRYRCTKCGNKCTVSVSKGNIPARCILDDREAHWMLEKDLPACNERMSIIRKNMISDAKGFFIRAIDPMNRDVVLVYRSINEASQDLGIPKGSISRAVKSDGRYRAGAYFWKRELLTLGQMEIKMAAQTSVEAYRQALKQYDPERYVEVFGGE